MVVGHETIYVANPGMMNLTTKETDGFVGRKQFPFSPVVIDTATTKRGIQTAAIANQWVFLVTEEVAIFKRQVPAIIEIHDTVCAVMDFGAFHPRIP
jgi:hypothetical protein